MVNTDLNNMSVNININDYSKFGNKPVSDIKSNDIAEASSDVPNLKDTNVSYKNLSSEGDELSVTEDGEISNKYGGKVLNLSEDGVVKSKDEIMSTLQPVASEKDDTTPKSTKAEDSAPKIAAEKASKAMEKANDDKSKREKTLDVAKEVNEKSVKIKENAIKLQKEEDSRKASPTGKRIITEDSVKNSASKQTSVKEPTKSGENSEQQLSSGELAGKTDAQIKSLYDEGRISQYTYNKVTNNDSEDEAAAVNLPSAVVNQANVIDTMEALAGTSDNPNAPVQGSTVVANILGVSSSGNA